MNTSLLAKLGSLSEKERKNFYKVLRDVLEDRYSCFVYGGIKGKEYAEIPEEKLEKIKINLYREIYENVIPPQKIITDFSKSVN